MPAYTRYVYVYTIQLVEILSLSLGVDHIKQRLRAKVSSGRRAHRLVRKRGVRFVDLDGLAAATSSRSVRQQLRVAAFLQTHEPEHALLDALADRQQAVVLQQRRLLLAQRLRDVLALLLGEDDPVELLVDDVVLWDELRSRI